MTHYPNTRTAACRVSLSRHAYLEPACNRCGTRIRRSTIWRGSIRWFVYHDDQFDEEVRPEHRPGPSIHERVEERLAELVVQGVLRPVEVNLLIDLNNGCSYRTLGDNYGRNPGAIWRWVRVLYTRLRSDPVLQRINDELARYEKGSSGTPDRIEQLMGGAAPEA